MHTRVGDGRPGILRGFGTDEVGLVGQRRRAWRLAEHAAHRIGPLAGQIDGQPVVKGFGEDVGRQDFLGLGAGVDAIAASGEIPDARRFVL
ncbi:MAG: hypothetical protein AW08_03928 [Candidatus Accumulibacter adjunctus]|uniref:Uncharacterized protein n=1 Tax=Candidatus Accumulibacter adjunctus TaxID=1454001 RepID=A0A011NH46_9PROT|nr:MAG: hypothetical protein AW08_03928 [Candidatus Accumulibacter adjunctus]